MGTPKIQPDNPIGLYYKLGYNLWKVQGSTGEWYYISAHLNPMYNYVQEDGDYSDPLYLLVCSCRSFSIGIPSSCKSPFVDPCKHIKQFDEGQVDIDQLELHS